MIQSVFLPNIFKKPFKVISLLIQWQLQIQVISIRTYLQCTVFQLDREKIQTFYFSGQEMQS